MNNIFPWKHTNFRFFFMNYLCFVQLLDALFLVFSLFYISLTATQSHAFIQLLYSFYYVKVAKLVICFHI